MAANRYDRARGVRELGPGVYEVRVRTPDPRTGRSRDVRRVVRCESIGLALVERDRIEATLSGGPTRSASPPRLRDYVHDWAERQEPMVRPSTRKRLREELGRLLGCLGDYYVDRIGPADLERWRGVMAAEGNRRRPGHGLAAATINSTMATARQVFAAIARDHGVPSPALGVRGVKTRRTHGRRGTALTLEQFRSFVAAVEAAAGHYIAEDIARMILALGWTGMRKGELLALRRSDVVDGELHIERAAWHHRIGPNKADDPRRVVVVEPLRGVLEAQEAWLKATDHPGLFSGLVFPASGHHARCGAARRGAEVDWTRGHTCMDAPLHEVCRRAGLPDISLHSLRRTLEDLKRVAGVDDLVRRAEGGWRDARTQAIYSTVRREDRERAGALVVALVTSSGAAGTAAGRSGRRGKRAPAAPR